MRAVKKVFSHRVQVVKGGNNKEKKSKETSWKNSLQKLSHKNTTTTVSFVDLRILQKKLNGCKAQGKNIEKQWQ